MHASLLPDSRGNVAGNSCQNRQPKQCSQEYPDAISQGDTGIGLAIWGVLGKVDGFLCGKQNQPDYWKERQGNEIQRTVGFHPYGNLV